IAPAVILLLIIVFPRRDGQLTAHDLGPSATDRFLAHMPYKTRHFATVGSVSGERVALASAVESKLMPSFAG
ncbi:MAG: hypothetical protein RSE44_27430, partial [Pseudomonas sp.]